MKAGRPSETALRIAALHVIGRDDPETRRLLADPEEPYSQRFIEAIGTGARLKLRFWRWARAFAMSRSEAIAPGAVLSLILRRHFIRDRILALLGGEAGSAPEQVVVLGAGFDPLCVTLAPRFPDVRWIEVDHPATQTPKRRALEAEGGIPAGVSLIAADLSRASLESVLEQVPDFRPGAATVWLAEGLLMYLDGPDIDQLFATFGRLSGPGSHFIFTVIEAAAMSDPDGAVARYSPLLERLGEPLKSSIERSNIPVFLGRHGFQAVQIADSGTLREAYLRPDETHRALLNAELIVVGNNQPPATRVTPRKKQPGSAAAANSGAAEPG